MQYDSAYRMPHSHDADRTRYEPKEEGFIGWAIRIICNILGVIFLFCGLSCLYCVYSYATIVEYCKKFNYPAPPISKYISLTIAYFALSIGCFYLKRFVKKAEC